MNHFKKHLEIYPKTASFLETDNAHIPISHIYQKAIEIRQNLDDFTKMKMFFISE
ncbi:hypothetical protein QIU18_10290 [Capnocytophaga canimorsus]|nr:hypothetical protein [Capnocytophaga canimorsus]WGU69941.1 hypothetical protein QIU18_10290 [Capnocytophaga canimorsus]